MIPTTADLYDETGRRARWLGALHGNADPETLRALASGRLLLEATDPATFADAVLDLLAVFTERGLGRSHHPRDGWPWSWPHSCTTDWGYIFDRGRAWVITGRIWSYAMPLVDHPPRQQSAATVHTETKPD
ncbi:hypothetical protein [Umezawaea tangerina]|uniref:Uncharacterized protein n=1 Tax=Umezawaea tangerina TaxID=84725 RepID=A0A2T0S744_9PSEU|nr:hypothetical protein [Umezawaea tangerina]PRY29215.1 hypothetical protein CLV43_12692 [Umezawaea tangerina]